MIIMSSSASFKLYNYMAQTRLRRRSTTPWIFSAALFLLFWAIFFHAPAREHSSDNNLLFSFASTDSPLKPLPVPLTAGVIPKRFHSHNDCKSHSGTRGSADESSGR